MGLAEMMMVSLAPMVTLLNSAARHAGEGAHRLALAARGNNDDLAVEIVFDLFHVDEHAFGNGQLADLGGCVPDVEHTPARKSHLAAVLCGKIDDLLQAMHVGSEGRPR